MSTPPEMPSTAAAGITNIPAKAGKSNILFIPNTTLIVLANSHSRVHRET